MLWSGFEMSLKSNAQKVKRHNAKFNLALQPMLRKQRQRKTPLPFTHFTIAGCRVICRAEEPARKQCSCNNCSVDYSSSVNQAWCHAQFEGCPLLNPCYGGGGWNQPPPVRFFAYSWKRLGVETRNFWYILSGIFHASREIFKLRSGQVTR